MLVRISACSQEPAEHVPGCDRAPVNRSGQLGASDGAETTAVLLALNQRAVFRVYAPLTRCAGDTPTFTAEGLDVDDSRVVLEDSRVFVDLTVTPTTAGSQLLSVRFEPNLGAAWC